MESFFTRYHRWSKNPNVVFPTLAVFVSGLGLLAQNLFPFDSVNLVFWSILMGLACLYRPNWCFLLLLALLPFEMLNLLPEAFGTSLRPYQWLFLLLAIALAIRVGTKRSAWPLLTLHPLDLFLGLLPIGALLSGMIAGGEGMRLGIIVASFYALYFLARVFFKTLNDVRLGLATFVAAGFPVLLYGIAQNISFEYGGTLSSVMPGRPNATFAEPDWLGFFAALLLILGIAKLVHSIQAIQDGRKTFFPSAFFETLLLVPVCAVLVISVSRSAWLGAGIGLAVWFGATLLSARRSTVRSVFQAAELSVIALIIALIAAVEMPLTRFDLMNRAESTATGLQEITVACERPTALPDRIETLSELLLLGCRHINLEERLVLEEAGYSIATTKRLDPNVEIRSTIYEKTWAEIKTHPVVGIGWGNIGVILGEDENGAAYNASNLWLETWLGAGIIGLLSLLGFFGWVAFEIGKRVLDREKQPVMDSAVLAGALLITFLTFNLFNAGLLIGFVWIFFAALPIIFPARIVKRA